MIGGAGHDPWATPLGAVCCRRCTGRSHRPPRLHTMCTYIPTIPRAGENAPHPSVPCAQVDRSSPTIMYHTWADSYSSPVLPHGTKLCLAFTFSTTMVVCLMNTLAASLPSTTGCLGLGQAVEAGGAPGPWLLLQPQQGAMAAGWEPRGCMLTLWPRGHSWTALI